MVACRGAHASTRAIAYFLHAQVENGTQCPFTMTYAASRCCSGMPTSAASAGVAFRARYGIATIRRWRVDAKHGRAVRDGHDGAAGRIGRAIQYDARRARRHVSRVHGHKWFFSAPQCDAHLVLARTADGRLFPPAALPRGRHAQRVRINRLKDKLGNRSNALAEVTFDGAQAWLLGEPGRGIATISTWSSTRGSIA